MSEKKYQIFISSTYEDLKEERQAAFNALMSLRKFIPIGMELFPAADIDQLEYIEPLIQESDYYLLIIGGKYGSLVAGKDISYTEAEYNLAKKHKIPIIALINKDRDNLPKNKSEQAHPDKLQKIIQAVQNDKRIVSFWKDKTEVRTRTGDSFASIEQNHPRDGWVRGGKENFKLEKENLKLKEENTNLLNKAAKKGVLKEENYLEKALEQEIEIKVVFYKDREKEYEKKSKASLLELIKDRKIEPQDEDDKELLICDLIDSDRENKGHVETVYISLRNIFYKLASSIYGCDFLSQIAHQHEIAKHLENLVKKALPQKSIKTKPDIYVETYKATQRFLSTFASLGLIRKQDVVADGSFVLTPSGKNLFEDEKLKRMSSNDD